MKITRDRLKALLQSMSLALVRVVKVVNWLQACGLGQGLLDIIKMLQLL